MARPLVPIALLIGVTQLPAQVLPSALRDPHRLCLRYAAFDPLAGEPEVPPALRARAGSRLQIVQWTAAPTEADRGSLRELGVELHAFFPDRSYVVRAEPVRRERVRALPFVRWLGAMHPAYKIEPTLLAELLRGELRGRACYDVVLVDRRSDEPALAAAIVALDGSVRTAAKGGLLLEAELEASALAALAAEDTVLWVQRTTPVGLDMDNARIQGGADYIEAKGGFTGKGIRGHVLEGVHASHPELGPTASRGLPIAVGDGTPDLHGTAAFGILFAQGTQPKARGMLPDGTGLYTNRAFLSGTNNRWTLAKDLVDPTLPHQAMFQDSSWGHAETQAYDARSAELDQVVLDHDLLITQSQGNSADRGSRPEAWAKNVISVGGYRHLDNANAADDAWDRSSSTGPAADGRVKPDLVAFSDLIFTTTSASGYGDFAGTSGSAAIVAGLAGLTIEMFTDGVFGYPQAPTQSQRFAYRPHAATVKALLINTARRYDPAANPGSTRFRQGWGFPSVQDLYDLRDQMQLLDELDVLKQAQTRSYTIFVPPGTPQLRVTMAYTDPPGAPPYAGPQRVNDLDLRVIEPHAHAVYWGNDGLAEGVWSRANGTKSDLDTVENVFISQPVPGLWTVEITAPLVAVDAHLETPAIDADFALVISGMHGPRNRTDLRLDLISNAPGQLRTVLQGVPANLFEGFVLYSLTTDRPLGTGGAFGIEVDALVIAIAGELPAPFNPFHFKPAGANYWPYAPYDWPPAIANLLSGRTIEAVSATHDIPHNILHCSNVARVKVK